MLECCGMLESCSVAPPKRFRNAGMLDFWNAGKLNEVLECWTAGVLGGDAGLRQQKQIACAKPKLQNGKIEGPEFVKSSGTLSFLNRSCLNFALSGYEQQNHEIHHKTHPTLLRLLECWVPERPNPGYNGAGLCQQKQIACAKPKLLN